MKYKFLLFFFIVFSFVILSSYIYSPVDDPNFEGYCGDGTCDVSETDECRDCPTGCGDGYCSYTEQGSNPCPIDCRFSNYPKCGDGEFQEEFEECDGLEYNGETCESQGFSSGTLGCKVNCTFDTSNCESEPVCGDGEVTGDEVCDPGNAENLANFDGETCQDYGFDGGDLQCINECSEISTDNCTYSYSHPDEIPVHPFVFGSVEYNGERLNKSQFSYDYSQDNYRHLYNSYEDSYTLYSPTQNTLNNFILKGTGLNYNTNIESYFSIKFLVEHNEYDVNTTYNLPIFPNR